MPKTVSYWKLAHHARSHLRGIENYDFDPVQFNHLQLINGQPFHERFPPEVRLRLEAGSEPIADYPVNPLGWVVMSDRLVTHLWPMINDAVQRFPAPLFEKGGNVVVPGYSVLNVVKVLDCVDVERSTPWFDSGKIGGFYDACIDPKRAGGAHMFKYVIPGGGTHFGVVCSNELIKSLESKGFTGLIFYRCRCKGKVENGAIGSQREKVSNG